MYLLHMRRRRFPFSSTWPCRLNRSKSRLRLPATCLLRSMSYLFKPMPTARPAVSDPISLNTLSIVHLLTWAYLLFVSDKNLNVSISGDVDEAKALSKPPDDSQGTMTTMFFCPTLNAIAAPLWVVTECVHLRWRERLWRWGGARKNGQY